jgi:hypothetical protein
MNHTYCVRGVSAHFYCHAFCTCDVWHIAHLFCNNLTEVTKTWLIWTRKKADWYDPFIESNDELLIEVNQDTLTLNRKSYY